MYILPCGGRQQGYYEIYLCNNIFEVSYAYPKRHEGSEYLRIYEENIAAALKQRIRELAEYYGHADHKILSRTIDEDNSLFFRWGINVTPSNHNIMRHQVQFAGMKAKLPQTTSGKNFFAFLRSASADRKLQRTHDIPTFLGEGMRFGYESNERRDRCLGINVCDKGKLTTYAVEADSVFRYSNGKIVFEKGSMVECPPTTIDPAPMAAFHNDRCNTKDITELE